MISSMASRGSDSAAAMVSMPTGPPPKFHGDASQIAMIERVEPARVDLELRERAIGDLRIDCAWPSTLAKSRTRRSSRPATRGVPRARRAISWAPSAVSGG